MNKIEVGNIILNNDTLFLDNKLVNKIVSNGCNEICLFNCNIKELDIELKPNSKLIINSFNNIDECVNTITIKSKDGSEIVLNHSFKVNKDYKLDILSDFLGDNATININLNGLNDGGKVFVNVDGFVKENKNDNILNENMHILNLNDGQAMSNPNMYIDTSKVIANHNTTIGGIDNNLLFYLMSKGINKDNGVKLISDGFIVSNITNDKLKDKIKDNL